MLTSFITLSLLHWVVLVTPGVNFLLVTQLAANGQRSSACYASIGITLATATWAVLAVLGVHAVFAAHEWLRLGLQIAGGAYLCWLAFKLWLSRVASAGSAPSDVVPPEPHMTALKALQTGLVTNLLNPKPALFFSSIFVAVLPVAANTSVIAAAIGLVWFNSLVWHLFLALAFSHASIQTTYASQRRRLDALAASVLGVMGGRLLLTSVNLDR